MSQNLAIPVTSCIAQPTAMQQNINAYFFQGSNFIYGYINSAQGREDFGNDSEGYYNKINNLWYLLMYLQVIADQQQIDINNGIINSCSYYSANFTCMVDYFKCLNIDITPLLSIFGFDCSGNIPSGPYGVGYDEIGTTLTVY